MPENKITPTQPHEGFRIDLGEILRIEYAPPRTRFSLRTAEPGIPAASIAFGLSLPNVIGKCSSDGDRTALRCGPDEMILWAPDNERDDIRTKFSTHENQIPFSLTDISDRNVGVTLIGSAATQAVNIGCPLDLHQIEIGHGTRTVFEQAEIVLLKLAHDEYLMEFARSYSAYVLDLLTSIGDELATGV
jgi:sarcosine oxidase subunit gamma